MILVSIILLLFLGNVRGALIVAVTIPFALLFASICLELMHIPANLLSLGALDFGVIVEGAVVLIENIVRQLSHSDGSKIVERDHRFCVARSAAAGVLRHRHHHHFVLAHLHVATRGRQALSSHGVDGGVCAAGGVVVLDCGGSGAGQFRVRQRHAGMEQPVMTYVIERYRRLRCVGRSATGAITVGLCLVMVAIGSYLAFSGAIGSEFLPHLDEGALWVRGTLAPSTGPDEGIRVANQARIVLCSFPEVPQCTSQVGRPDDGTDNTGFFNTEYFVDLKPKEQWRPVFHENKDELIAAMNRELEQDSRRRVGIFPTD